MIQEVELRDFKNISHQIFEFKPITVFTGKNSTGKTSVIQSVLCAMSIGLKGAPSLLDEVITFSESMRNRYNNSKEIGIRIVVDNCAYNTSVSFVDSIKMTIGGEEMSLKYEDNLYYLCANRNGYNTISKIKPSCKVGFDGRYIFATYELEKSNPVISKLVKFKESETLASQVSYWLGEILGVGRIDVQTQRIAGDNVILSYNADEIQGISPQNLGAGVSYLAQILITCLRAQENDVIMIENPEIHLYPAAQARLGDFFVFVANAGIQLVLETHCGFILDKLCYSVLRRKIEKEKIALFYKNSIREDFLEIKINSNGKFSEDLPDDFYAPTLAELLSME